MVSLTGRQDVPAERRVWLMGAGSGPLLDDEAAVDVELVERDPWRGGVLDHQLDGHVDEVAMLEHLGQPRLLAGVSEP